MTCQTIVRNQWSNLGVEIDLFGRNAVPFHDRQQYDQERKQSDAGVTRLEKKFHGSALYQNRGVKEIDAE